MLCIWDYPVEEWRRVLAIDLEGAFLCNRAIVPGMIDTPQSRGSTGSTEVFEKRRRENPGGHLGTPEDVANMMLYLACEESSFVTGASFVIDGGRTVGY